MPKTSTIDWEAIKEEYESTDISVAVLALKFHISNVTIYGHIKAEGWKRPALDKEENNNDTGQDEEDDEDILEPEPDEELPDQAEIARLQMEAAVYAAKAAVARLLREVDRKTPQIGEIDRLIHDETMGDAVYRRRKVLRYVLTLPSRCAAMKNLASSIKTLYEIEQMANGIAPGNRSKKANVQAKAERLVGKFDVPTIETPAAPRIDVKKYAAV